MFQVKLISCFISAKKKITPLLFILALPFTTSHAAESDQQLWASGQWRDPATNLIWMRCNIGETWSGNSCAGQPLKLSWKDANDYFELFNQDGFAGKHNWRLPNINELSSLRRCSKGWAHTIETIGNVRKDMGVNYIDDGLPYFCADGSNKPAVANALAESTLTDEFYWSASPDAPDSDYAWSLGFYFGYSNFDNFERNLYYVRAVRSGM